MKHMQLRDFLTRRSTRNRVAPNQDSILPTKAQEAEAKQALKESSKLKSDERAALRLELFESGSEFEDRVHGVESRIRTAVRSIEKSKGMPELHDRAVHHLATAMTDLPSLATQTNAFGQGLDTLGQLEADGSGRALEALASLATAKTPDGHALKIDGLADHVASQSRETLANTFDEATDMPAELSALVLDHLSQQDLAQSAAGRYRLDASGIKAPMPVGLRGAMRIGRAVGEIRATKHDKTTTFTVPGLAQLGAAVAAVQYGVGKGVKALGSLVRGSDD